MGTFKATHTDRFGWFFIWKAIINRGKHKHITTMPDSYAIDYRPEIVHATCMWNQSETCITVRISIVCRPLGTVKNQREYYGVVQQNYDIKLDAASQFCIAVLGLCLQTTKLVSLVHCSRHKRNTDFDRQIVLRHTPHLDLRHVLFHDHSVSARHSPKLATCEVWNKPRRIDGAPDWTNQELWRNWIWMKWKRNSFIMREM